MTRRPDGAESGGSEASGPAPERLVVYGSLMRGLPGPGAAAGDLLDRLGVGPGLERIGECRVSGRLFDLGPYPALRPAAAGADEVVVGELHRVLDSGIFAVLDAFEGFDPTDRAGSDYLRERIALLEPRDGEAWIYVYNREPDPGRRIPGGDWRRHLAERRDRAHVPD